MERGREVVIMPGGLQRGRGEGILQSVLQSWSFGLSRGRTKNKNAEMIKQREKKLCNREESGDGVWRGRGE